MKSVCASVVFLIVLSACHRQPAAPPEYLAALSAHRATVDSTMRSDPSSPFLRDSSIQFTGIKWFPPDYAFRAEARLHRYPDPSEIVTRGTKGEERHVIRYGILTFTLQQREFRLNVYKFTEAELKQRGEGLRSYLMVWFTDLTTGKETYPVGRYVEIDLESPDSTHIYVIDFNKAYNPYCAYTSHYSCAVPTRDDVLDLAINAGEKKYHDDH
ncbi:MAG: DUF1684 domain-containing protein [Ignavibacteriales bacterium]|nr:DUF1684 domain-containing protein [Ignavibacteriales bacterium]